MGLIKELREEYRSYRYFVFSFLVICTIIALSYVFSQHIPEDHEMLMLVIILSGACGGILFAIRESVLTWPQLKDNTIHLGWISDCVYGIAGAFAVFLLVPGLSESATTGFKELHDRAHLEIKRAELEIASAEEKIQLLAAANGGQNNTDNNGSGMDLIEIIAVAIVGGYAGRSVLRQTQNQILQQEKAQVVAEAKKETLEHAQTDAMALAYCHRLSSDRAEEIPLEQFEKALNEATPTAKAYAFEIIRDGIESTADLSEQTRKVALQALDKIDQADDLPEQHAIAALRARLFGQQEAWQDAKSAIERSLSLLEKSSNKANYLAEYKDFLEICTQRLEKPKKSRRKTASSA